MSLRVSEGEEVRIGEALVRVNEGALTVRDPYVRKEFLLRGSVEVRVEPSVPVHVPKSLTGCILLKLNPPLILEGVEELRLTAPYELRVLAGSEVVAHLSPFRVKYTVLGTPSEGVICRFYPSEVLDGLPLTVEAYLTAEIGGEGHALVDGLVLEDITVVPMKYEVGEGRFFIAYGPVKAYKVGNYFFTPARTALGRLTAILRSATTLTFVRGP